MKWKQLFFVVVLLITINVHPDVLADFYCSLPTTIEIEGRCGYFKQDCSVSMDGLTIYYSACSTPRSPTGQFLRDIWMATRDSLQEDWSNPQCLKLRCSDSMGLYDPSMREDGLALYYRCATKGLMMTSRASLNKPWRTPRPLRIDIDDNLTLEDPEVSSDGKTLFFSCDAGGGDLDLWQAQMNKDTGIWDSVAPLTGYINSLNDDFDPTVSTDGQVLVFSSLRKGGKGEENLYVSRFLSHTNKWGPAKNLGRLVNCREWQNGPELSSDGRTLYFGDGCSQLYRSEICPCPDLDNNGIVDKGDLSMLLECWGENIPCLDIGPTPMGDGIINEEDVKVVMDHWQETVANQSLIAHWPLDELSGTIAHEKIQDKNGTVHGTPEWLPEGGIWDGALLLNGSSYIRTPYILDPAVGAFSVYLWLQGGNPGEVVLSQLYSCDWLKLDEYGCIVTDFNGSLHGANALSTRRSNGQLHPDEWYYVGFVWDGARRHLYVNDQLSVSDASDMMQPKTLYTGLCVGGSSNLKHDSLWTGYVDDVRIYDGIVK